MEEAVFGPPGPQRSSARWNGLRTRARIGGWGMRWRSAILVPAMVASFASAPLAMAPAAADEAMPPAARERIPDGTAVRVLGREVKNPSGEVVAQIVNVLVDGAGQPLAAVLDYGGFMGVGKRRIAVAWRALSFVPGGTPGSSTIILGLGRDELKSFPDHKDGDPVVVAAPVDAGATVPAASGAPTAAPD